MSNKKRNRYLTIPADFHGFSYEEVKIRRAMLEMKRDLLKMKIAEHRELLKQASPLNSLANSRVGRFLGLNKKILPGGEQQGKKGLSKLISAVSMGVTVYSIYRNIRGRRNGK